MVNFFRILARVFSLTRTAALAAIAFGFAASVSLAAVSPSEKRVALVIGNGAYENAVRLDNAAFDARAVADAFRKLGFQVVDGYDLDIDQMRAKVSEFSAALSDSKSAVIYYAGHGISVDEENYLVPTDIVLKSPTDLDLNAISVSLLLKQMKRDDRVNIVILDACRDNPFAAELAKHKTRALVVERGLTPHRRRSRARHADRIRQRPEEHRPRWAGRSAQPVHAGVPRSSCSTPGVTIDTVMSRVRNEVWEKTGHNQLPWVNTSLIGEYELNPQPLPEDWRSAKPSASSRRNPLADPRQAQENLMWESAQHSNLAPTIRPISSAFPGGMFAQMAKNRIASMEAARASAPTPAPQTLAMTEPIGPQRRPN